MIQRMRVIGACLLLSVGVSAASASASKLEDTTAKAALLAVYGSPGSNGAEVPVGGGLGRSVGLGANLLFEACEKCTTVSGKNLSITLGGVALEWADVVLGVTLLSDKTSPTSPVSLGVEFVDFQQGAIAKEPVPTYSDTWDRPWTGVVCGEEAICKVDVRKGGEASRLCKLEDVGFNIGPGTVIQGTLWCKWINGAAEKAPCIELTEPPASAETKFDALYETRGSSVGARVEQLKGVACVVSAQNNYYSVTATELKHDAITLE